MKIFVQIASYRDPQLVHTIKNMIENAKNPNNLRFGIARQFHSDDKFDDLSEYNEDDRFKIINIPYQESKGVCWARNLTQQLTLSKLVENQMFQVPTLDLLVL